MQIKWANTSQIEKKNNTKQNRKVESTNELQCKK